MRMPSSRALLAGTILTAAIATAGTAFAAVTNPVPVRTNPGDEYAYKVSGSTAIWYQNSPTNRNHYNAYIQTSSGLKQMNAPGTVGVAGGIDGTTVIFQQIGSFSRLIRYNIATNTRTVLGSGFNAPNSAQYTPSVSGNWVLFGRQTGARQTVLLRNLSTGEQRTLATTNNQKLNLIPGQVNGDWAVWMLYGPTSSTVYRYQISTHTGGKLLNTLPPAKFEYSPVVASDGTAYYMHAGARCGDHARLVMHGVGQPETALRTFSQGIDANNTFATAGTSGTDIYFARLTCKTGRTDIYKVTNN